MRALHIRLFGKLSVECDQHALTGLELSKVQELFCYLLVNRDRSHAREALAGLLWGDSPTAKSKKYLRQALWQLQSALNGANEPVGQGLLVVGDEWVDMNSDSNLWIDVAAFQQAWNEFGSLPDRDLTDSAVEVLKEAAELYHGDLLEGWYHDWCIYERERLQSLYLEMLGKLMGYSEVHEDYQTGLAYGSRILHYDRAHERTHRRLMRMYYMAGDRTAALRQYQRCMAALDEELGVAPARSTKELYEQIKADRLEPVTLARGSVTDSAPLQGLLDRLHRLRRSLVETHRQLRQEIREVETFLKGRR